ncbi:hypothetical protein TSAR_011823 [Trichomalopsis sarcophagae]|uniref:Uncharacterized protein n=1 Tax=Trichomalopsis sarcophagae TaxID=543379 RepID=A0A232F639_9HYME|nr:hypothetical protein TSAR_011823 [Trichomalopsis sarcophagae]
MYEQDSARIRIFGAVRMLNEEIVRGARFGSCNYLLLSAPRSRAVLQAGGGQWELCFENNFW